MKSISKPKLSPIKQRKQKLVEKLDEFRHQASTRTRDDFKSAAAYTRWQNDLPTKIAAYEEELSILDDPSKHDSLPPAVVAEELGLSIEVIRSLIDYGEIEPTDTSEENPASAKIRVSRAELAQLIKVGSDELLRLYKQDVTLIFEGALHHIQDGDVKAAEKAYRRIEPRAFAAGLYAYEEAYKIGVALMKGDFDDAQYYITSLLRDDPIERTVTLSYLARILRPTRFIDHTAELIREHLLSLADGSNANGSRFAAVGEHLDETQQRALYIATAVEEAIKKYKFKAQFLSYRSRNSSIREEEIKSIFYNAIYTALHAEETYKESAASKLHVDTIKSLISNSRFV